MTGRAAAIQGGLATAGLLAVYLTWQREPERAPGAATVIDAVKAEVTHVHYADDSNSVDFERGQDNAGAAIWIHLAPTGKAIPKPGAKGKSDKPPDSAARPHRQ